MKCVHGNKLEGGEPRLLENIYWYHLRMLLARDKLSLRALSLQVDMPYSTLYDIIIRKRPTVRRATIVLLSHRLGYSYFEDYSAEVEFSSEHHFIPSKRKKGVVSWINKEVNQIKKLWKYGKELFGRIRQG